MPSLYSFGSFFGSKFLNCVKIFSPINLSPISVNLLYKKNHRFVWNVASIVQTTGFFTTPLLPTLMSLGSNISSISANTILSFLTAAILVFIALLYILIILPINYMAIAHMANNNGTIMAAFRFHEIIDKIGTIGWGNLILWYLVTGTIYIIISLVGAIITGIFSIINPIVSIILNSLIIYPYLNIYLNRSIALFYLSKK